MTVSPPHLEVFLFPREEGEFVTPQPRQAELTRGKVEAIKPSISHFHISQGVVMLLEGSLGGGAIATDFVRIMGCHGFPGDCSYHLSVRTS